MRSWRNWQTRKTKDLVGNSMQVQFLSTAPQKRKSHLRFPFLFYAFLDKNCGWEPFCESKTLCLMNVGNGKRKTAKATIDNRRVGRAAKGAIPVDRTTKKEIPNGVSFFVFCQ